MCSNQITLVASTAAPYREPSPCPSPSLPDIPTLTSLCSPDLSSSSYPFCHISPRHRIYSALPRIPPAKTTSLHDLFTRHYPISVKERFQLALKLASSVLQLHSSGWLQESWSSKDVKFLESPTGVMVNNPISIIRTHQSQPRQGMQQQQQQQYHHPSYLPPSCNRTLFSLGVVLIELCHNRSLDDPWLQAQCRQPEILDDETRRYDLAYQLVKSLSDNASPGYEAAARRCISGLDCRENTLEDEDFRKSMYESVLGPLKKTLERFGGVER